MTSFRAVGFTVLLSRVQQFSKNLGDTSKFYASESDRKHIQFSGHTSNIMAPRGRERWYPELVILSC
jgi:hypothetical protein